MRDFFFTILAIWLIWRIFESIKVTRLSNRDNYTNQSKEGEVKVKYQAPKKNDKDDEGGEYVDYEEVK